MTGGKWNGKLTTSSSQGYLWTEGRAPCDARVGGGGVVEREHSFLPLVHLQTEAYPWKELVGICRYHNILTLFFEHPNVSSVFTVETWHPDNRTTLLFPEMWCRMTCDGRRFWTMCRRRHVCVSYIWDDSWGPVTRTSGLTFSGFSRTLPIASLSLTIVIF